MRSIAGAIVLTTGAAIAASALPEVGRFILGLLLLGAGIALLFSAWNDAKPKP